MDIITGYKGEAHITAAQDGAVNAGMIGDDTFILPVNGRLAATAISANEVQIASGVLVVQGRFAAIDYGAYDSLSISNGEQGMNRNDLIVARYSKNGAGVESIQLDVIEGTSSSGTAVDPAYTDGDILSGDTLVEVPLYRVKVSGITISGIDALVPVASSMASVETDIAALEAGLSACPRILTKNAAASGGSAAFNMSNVRGILVLSGISVQAKAAYIVAVSSAGAVSTKEIVAPGTGVTISTASGKLTVENGSSAAISATLLMFVGSAT